MCENNAVNYRSGLLKLMPNVLKEKQVLENKYSNVLPAGCTQEGQLVIHIKSLQRRMLSGFLKQKVWEVRLWSEAIFAGCRSGVLRTRGSTELFLRLNMFMLKMELNFI